MGHLVDPVVKGRAHQENVLDHLCVAGDQYPNVSPDKGRQRVEGGYREKADIGFAAQDGLGNLDVGFAAELDGVAGVEIGRFEQDASDGVDAGVVGARQACSGREIGNALSGAFGGAGSRLFCGKTVSALLVWRQRGDLPVCK